MKGESDYYDFPDTSSYGYGSFRDVNDYPDGRGNSQLSLMSDEGKRGGYDGVVADMPQNTNDEYGGGPAGSPASGKGPRLHVPSIDVFRGLCMLGMIIVDNQGNFDYVYEQLNEDFWNGLRLCNFVFPCFLLVMGMVIPLSLANARRRPGYGATLRIIYRSIALIGIGVTLSAFAHQFENSPFRLPGVLQRIGICYFVCASLYCFAGRWRGGVGAFVERFVIALFLGIYIYFMYWYHVPNCGRKKLTAQCNAGAYFDEIIFHRYRIHPNDPEGLLTTCTAILTTAIGVEAGRVVVYYRKRMSDEAQQPGLSHSLLGGSSHQAHKALHNKIAASWMVLGGFSLSAGAFLHLVGFSKFNKKIWSISFATFTAGSGLLCLALFHYIVVHWPYSENTKGWNRLENQMRQTGPRQRVPVIFAPLNWLGRNALLVFIMMVCLEIYMLDWQTAMYKGERVTLYEYVYWQYFQSWIDDKKLASLVTSFAHLILWTLFAFILFKFNIRFRL